MRKQLFLFFTVIAISLQVHAILPSNIRFHNEHTDTARINQILAETSKKEFNNSHERILFIARQFIGTPYVANTLEHGNEILTINMSELDCTTFVETVMALARTAAEGRMSWRDYAHSLQLLRYRNGKINGYASRLHYISDWIIDNSHRGNLKEATSSIPNSDYSVKTIDFMTSHRDLYKALSDSCEFEKLKNIEVGYRSHRFPYIKREKIAKNATYNALQEGDIVALTCRTQGLDVSHLGIIFKINGIPHLLHASSKAKAVIEDPLPLSDYLRRSRSLTGIRVIRLSE